MMIRKKILLLLQSRVEDRLDDAIHVLRNHAEPVAHGGHLLDTSRLAQSASHSSELLFSSTNGLTFSAGQAIHSAVSQSETHIALC